MTRAMPPRAPARREAAGFTLVELMVTLAVAAILVTIAVPSFRATVQNNRAATQANEFLTALNLARSEAIRRSTTVSVCSSNADQSDCANSTDWATGWIVFTDVNANGDLDAGADTVIRVWERLTGNPTLTGDVDSASFLPTGMATATADFSLTIPNSTVGQKKICLAVSGRSAITSSTTCP